MKAYQYLDDLQSAVGARVSGSPGEAYNIASDERLTLGEVLARLAHMLTGRLAEQEARP